METTLVKPVKIRRSLRTKFKAMEMYLSGGYTGQQIADALVIPFTTLVNWMHVGGWVEKRRTMIAELEDRLMLGTMQFHAENRLKIMQQHVEIGTKFEHEVKRNLDSRPANEVIHSRDLADLGKALQAGTTVTARAVGLDKLDPSRDQATKVALLINNNINPTPVDPPRPQISPKTITIPSESSNDEF